MVEKEVQPILRAVIVRYGLIALIVGLAVLIASIGHHGSPGSGSPSSTTCTVHQGNTPARRNIVWRVLNDGTHDMSESPEAGIAAGLALIIHSQSNKEMRDKALNHLFHKGLLFLSQEEAATLHNDLFQETNSSTRAEALRKLMSNDLTAAELIHGVLSDKKRVNLFLKGEKIPLEILPDGTKP